MLKNENKGESGKESPTNVQSDKKDQTTNNQPAPEVKPTDEGKGSGSDDLPKTPDGDTDWKAYAEKLENEKKALAGIQSSKDKETKEIADKVNKLENETKVKDLLIESDYPQEVKDVLKKNLGVLTPENFTDKATEYLNVFNAGKDVAKKVTEDFSKDDPDPEKAKSFQEAVEKVQSPEDLEKLVKNQSKK